MSVNKTKLNCGDTLEEKKLFIAKATFDLNTLVDILIGVWTEFKPNPDFSRNLGFEEVKIVDRISGWRLIKAGYMLINRYYCEKESNEFYESDLRNYIGWNSVVFFQTQSIDTFKAYDFANNKSDVECQIRCGKLTAFIRDFIDSLITYKIENNVDNLTPSQIEDIKLDFFISRFDEIESNYKRLDEREAQELRNLEANYLKATEKVNTKRKEIKKHYDSAVSKYKRSN